MTSLDKGQYSLLKYANGQYGIMRCCLFFDFMIGWRSIGWGQVLLILIVTLLGKVGVHYSNIHVQTDSVELCIAVCFLISCSDAVLLSLENDQLARARCCKY